MITVKRSPALDKLYHRYTGLAIGKHQVACPYWMDKNIKHIFGPGGGKATPDEIEGFAASLAQTLAIDLSKLTKTEIISFLKHNRLGVDCSGFAFWLLDALDREKGGNGIADIIPGSRGKFIKARASVAMLTAKAVAVPVGLVDVQLGDMIRLKKGNHVLVITGLTFDEHRCLISIEYSHSSLGIGVHRNAITLTDKTLPTSDQHWHETGRNGLSLSHSLISKSGDGIYRLKIWVHCHSGR